LWRGRAQAHLRGTSRYGLIAFGSSLDCPGPLARDVSDAALMLQVLAGLDPKDSTSALAPVPDYLAALQEGVRGMRIGLSRDYDHITYRTRSPAK
jgi:aspartyl-tRNA(Asn)/glutamyl-tRNA(Gln) amidotransferase subunit A